MDLLMMKYNNHHHIYLRIQQKFQIQKKTILGSDGKAKTITGKVGKPIAGRVIIHNEGTPDDDYDAKPVQNWTGTDLGIYDYFTGGEEIFINETEDNKKGSAGNAQNQGNATRLGKGCYGLYDAGTYDYDTTHYLETVWYAGYCFKDGEDKVKEKIFARAESLGLFFTNIPDPWDIWNNNNKQYYTNQKLKSIKNANAVWMKVLDMNQ